MTNLTSTLPKQVWASLITNLDYLPGLLTLHHTLTHIHKTAYPFIAFYTSSFPPQGLAVLTARDIPARLVPSIQPAHSRVYDQDPRFQETWTKLVVFGLVEYERVVLLDGDMLVRRGMDELMEVELDGVEGGEVGGIAGNDTGKEAGIGNRVFAACHACACNPLKKPHYPSTWTPQNCAYTTQHPNPINAQITAPPSSTGVSMLNSGLLIAHPSPQTWSQIQSVLNDPHRLSQYDFPDQELLSDVFRGRWVALPYVYNALKTLRWRGVHGDIWRDEEVRVVHYIFARKPWHDFVEPVTGSIAGAGAVDETHLWWWEANDRRKHWEKERGIIDAYSIDR